MDKLLSFLPLMRLNATLGVGFLFIVLIMLSNSHAAEKTDCVSYVKKQRDYASKYAQPLTRKEQKGLLLNCQNRQLAALIAEQKETLSKLDAEIQKFQLRIDEKSQILDKQGRVLGKIVSINGKLTLRIEQLDAEIEQRLKWVERYLLENS